MSETVYVWAFVIIGCGGIRYLVATKEQMSEIASWCGSVVPPPLRGVYFWILGIHEAFDDSDGYIQ